MKIGRNDPCPCGSGKKYKKYCLIKKLDLDLTPIEFDKFPLYKVLISKLAGSRQIVVARHRPNGNICFISVLVDEWKMGLKDCFGKEDIPKELFFNFLHNPLKMIDLRKCKEIIKRGLLIAKEVGAPIPKEWYKYKKIVGNLDKIKLTGSLYKCFKCGKGDLSDEIIETIKKATRLDMLRGKCGKEGEIMIYPICDECKKEANEKIEIKGKNYGLKRMVSDRKISVAKIKENEIIIDLSSRLSKEQQDKVFENLKKRMLKRLKKGPRPRFSEELREIKDGEIICVDNENYSIKIKKNPYSRKTSRANIINKQIEIIVPECLSKETRIKTIYDLIRQVISDQRLPKLKKLITELNEKHFQVNINNIKFRSQKTRWGSYSSKGNINISYRLLFAPLDILKYVCIHELAHFKEQNHSERFWDLVRKVMPDYKEKINWLKENGHKCRL